MSNQISEVELFQYFYADHVESHVLDILWADGWRHFGSYFFRNIADIMGEEIALILPLRVDMTRFAANKSQRRVLRKNADLRVVFEPVNITDEYERLFERHAARFTQNVPSSLYDFLSDNVASVPCTTYQCSVYVPSLAGERLIAASFLDSGETTMSSVYAMFEPDEAKRSLGIFTFLCEFEYARRLGKQYVYLGYAHGASSVPSCYEYKKQFTATERYNWRGDWEPLLSI